MVKPRGKNKEEELPLAVLSKGKGVSKKPNDKSKKKNTDSSKNAVVVKEKQSMNRSKEHGMFILIQEVYFDFSIRWFDEFADLLMHFTL